MENLLVQIIDSVSSFPKQMQISIIREYRTPLQKARLLECYNEQIGYFLIKMRKRSDRRHSLPPGREWAVVKRIFEFKPPIAEPLFLCQVEEGEIAIAYKALSPQQWSINEKSLYQLSNVIRQFQNTPIPPHFPGLVFNKYQFEWELNYLTHQIHLPLKYRDLLPFLWATASSQIESDLVLTHGDLHLSQFVYSEGNFFIVDLDTLCLAPPEFDVSFFLLSLPHNNYRRLFAQYYYGDSLGSKADSLLFFGVRHALWIHENNVVPNTIKERILKALDEYLSWLRESRGN